MNQDSNWLPDQLLLDFKLPDNTRFENFVVGPNGELVRALTDMASGIGESSLYLWGEAGSGKTHLLHAVCHRAGNDGVPSAYLPLAEINRMSTGVLQGMESLDLICVDDVDAVAGNRNWEEALFDLFNRIKDSKGRMVMAGMARPDSLGLDLPDLVSRVAWGPMYPINALDDAGRLEILQRRASERGFELPGDAGRYLLRHYPRDLPGLCALLDRLDHASLVAQRRLTIPFVKSALEN